MRFSWTGAAKAIAYCRPSRGCSPRTRLQKQTRQKKQPRRGGAKKPALRLQTESAELYARTDPFAGIEEPLGGPYQHRHETTPSRLSIGHDRAAIAVAV